LGRQLCPDANGEGQQSLTRQGPKSPDILGNLLGGNQFVADPAARHGIAASSAGFLAHFTESRLHPETSRRKGADAGVHFFPLSPKDKN